MKPAEVTVHEPWQSFYNREGVKAKVTVKSNVLRLKQDILPPYFMLSKKVSIFMGDFEMLLYIKKENNNKKKQQRT